MRTLPKSFSMRKGGRPPQGDWFKITNKSNDVAEVFIYDEIGFWGTTANDFVKELQGIEAKEIHLRINSPGGAVFDGIAIYNALIRHSAKVTSFVDALAASAASFISQAGDQVIMAKGSTMMIHDGLAICVGNEEDMLKTAQVLNKISTNIASIYSDRAGGSVADWRAVMREEVWFTADEAVEANLADEVLSSSDEDAQEATDKWDLSVFNFAGREDAPDPSLVRERIEVANRKETSMSGRPKSTAVNTDPPENTDDPPEQTDPPETDPPEADPPETDDPPEQTDPPAPQTSQLASGVMIDGQMVTDPTAIQSHVTALETAQTEARNANIRAFVEKLSEDDKILASAVDGLVTLAQTFNAEQYKAWSASYESAPKQPVLTPMGTGAENPKSNLNRTPEEAKKDQVQIWEQTVAMHERSGMSKEQIERTDSWKSLQEHKAASDKS